MTTGLEFKSIRDQTTDERPMANLYLLSGAHRITFTAAGSGSQPPGDYVLDITRTEELTDGAKGRIAYGKVIRPDGTEDHPKSLWLGQLVPDQEVKIGDKLVGALVNLSIGGQKFF